MSVANLYSRATKLDRSEIQYHYQQQASYVSLQMGTFTVGYEDGVIYVDVSEEVDLGKFADNIRKVQSVSDQENCRRILIRRTKSTGSKPSALQQAEILKSFELENDVKIAMVASDRTCPETLGFLEAILQSTSEINGRHFDDEKSAMAWLVAE